MMERRNGSAGGMSVRRAWLILACLLLATAVIRPASADFRSGLRAYGNGDFVTAAAEWRAAAETGDAMANYRLGQMLVYGIGVVRDPNAGVAALRVAAEAGLTLAQSDLAELRFEGRIIDQDYAVSLRWSREAAEAGDVASLYRLGQHYDRGLAVDLDYRKALEFYQEAANQGLPVAQRRVGQYYEAGITVLRDLDDAMAWYRSAAEGRDPVALVKLAIAHETGVGAPKSMAQAVTFYRWAAEEGELTGQLAMGQLYMHRRPIPIKTKVEDTADDDERNSEEAEKSEESETAKSDDEEEKAPTYDSSIEDPEAAGLPAVPDPAEAEFWLRRAAATGAVQGERLLAQHLLRDADETVDYYEAFDLLAEARRKNDASADALLRGFAELLPREYSYDLIENANEYEPAAFCMLAYAVEAWADIDKRCGSFARFGQVVPLYVLGQVYERGLGVEADPATAAELYSLAGRNGYARAQNALGRLLIRGIGAQKDPKQGAQWIQQAASRSYAPAQFNLGFMYERGLGVQHNPIAAANWYRRAAQQGHARAQYNLAAHLATGVGLPENRIQAYKWLLLAETPQGVDTGEGPLLRLSAEGLRRQLQAQMTPAEIDRAHRLALEFRPGS